jgi:hypothetical protein
MEGIGLLVVMSFVILTLAIVTNTCSDWSVFSKKEGFAQQAKVVPAPTKLDTSNEPKGYTNLAELPGAPVTGLAEANSFPFEDPALAKATLKTLNELKQDMDGFASFEMPNIDGKSDPAVKLPLTRFKGDYQRIKDEVATLGVNPGLQSQLTLEDVFTMAANLRFLQRTYRLYAGNNMVPQARGGLSQVGITNVSEGFVSSDSTTPITSDQLNDLSLKLAVEITRLQASGTTDPVIQARTNVFSKIKQTIDDLNTKFKAGGLSAKDIPIMVSDYKNFLPVLTSPTTPVGQLVTASGNSSLGSLFNQFQAGDLSGQQLAGALFEKYAEDLVKGTSLELKYTYTSPRMAETEKARAVQAQLGAAQGMNSVTDQILGGGGGHPGTSAGSRGQFESIVRRMDLQGFQGEGAPLEESNSIRPPTKAPTQIGSFDWQKKADEITLNIRKGGMNPADFGALAPGASVSSDYSWRGHCKMMCSRLATNADPGVPELMGCPPVEWKGWRL